MPSKVLIVQSNETQTDYIEEILIEAKYTLQPQLAGFWYARPLVVETANCVQSALSISRDFDPDVVIIDTELDAGEGAVLSRQLTEQRNYSIGDKKAILLTVPEDDTGIFSPHMGYDLILRGHFESHDLLEAMKELLMSIGHFNNYSRAIA